MPLQDVNCVLVVIKTSCCVVYFRIGGFLYIHCRSLPMAIASIGASAQGGGSGSCLLFAPETLRPLMGNIPKFVL